MHSYATPVAWWLLSVYSASEAFLDSCLAGRPLANEARRRPRHRYGAEDFGVLDWEGLKRSDPLLVCRNSRVSGFSTVCGERLKAKGLDYSYINPI